MHISKLTMSQDEPLSLRSIADPYEMHRTIWRAFPDSENGGAGRVLFRVEPLVTGRPVVVLVQSRDKPDWEPLLSEGIIVDALTKSVDLKPPAGRLLRFRLLANPSKKITLNDQVDDQGQPRKSRVGLFGEDKQRQWLERKAKQSGFELCEYAISATSNLDSRKPGQSNGIRHHAVRFDGILRVTDADVFAKTLESGIGSAKGFGFGLLSVAPVR